MARRTPIREVKRVADVRLVVDLLMDLQLYERVPLLIPLRDSMLTVYSRLCRLSEVKPMADDTVRGWYNELYGEFIRFVAMLVKDGYIKELQPIKGLLRDRHQLVIEHLIIPCPGLGRVEI